MCIGMHLGMAEMTTLVSALYRRYETKVVNRQEGVSPGITSRFEVFYDERFERMEVSRPYFETGRIIRGKTARMAKLTGDGRNIHAGYSLSSIKPDAHVQSSCRDVFRRIQERTRMFSSQTVSCP